MEEEESYEQINMENKRKSKNKEREKEDEGSMADRDDESKDKRNCRQNKEKFASLSTKAYYKIFDKINKYCKDLRSKDTYKLKDINNGSLTNIINENLGLIYYGEDKDHVGSEFYDIVRDVYKTNNKQFDDSKQSDIDEFNKFDRKILSQAGINGFILIRPDSCVITISEDLINTIIQIFEKYNLISPTDKIPGLIREIEKIRGKFVNLSAETQIRVGEDLRKLYDIMQTK